MVIRVAGWDRPYTRVLSDVVGAAVHVDVDVAVHVALLAAGREELLAEEDAGRARDLLLRRQTVRSLTPV